MTTYLVWPQLTDVHNAGRLSVYDFVCLSRFIVPDVWDVLCNDDVQYVNRHVSPCRAAPHAMLVLASLSSARAVDVLLARRPIYSRSLRLCGTHYM